jgi:hypothetical protein
MEVACDSYKGRPLPSEMPTTSIFLLLLDILVSFQGYYRFPGLLRSYTHRSKAVEVRLLVPDYPKAVILPLESQIITLRIILVSSGLLSSVPLSPRCRRNPPFQLVLALVFVAELRYQRYKFQPIPLPVVSISDSALIFVHILVFFKSLNIYQRIRRNLLSRCRNNAPLRLVMVLEVMVSDHMTGSQLHNQTTFVSIPARPLA